VELECANLDWEKMRIDSGKGCDDLEL